MPNITGDQLIKEVETLAAGAGDKYVWGGTTSAGYDCSGLIYAALTKLGYSNVPRTSEAQWAWAQQQGTSFTDQSKLQPGDLVFANFGNEVSPGHVGIYIGGGKVYSAESPSSGIGTDTLADWGSNIVGYAKVPNETTSADTGASLDSSIGGVFSWPGDITGFFKDAKTFVDALLWIVKPSSWLRIGSFMIAGILLLFGLYVLMKVGSDEPIFKMPQVVPVPV